MSKLEKIWRAERMMWSHLVWGVPEIGVPPDHPNFNAGWWFGTFLFFPSIGNNDPK